MLISNQKWSSPELIFDENGNSKLSLTGGVFYYFAFSDRFGINAEINFVKEGSVLPNAFTKLQIGDTSTSSAENILYYVSVPLLIKINFKFNSFIPFIAIGPRFDWLIEYSTLGYKPDQELDKIDYGISFGLGTRYSINNKLEGIIEARYNKSIKDIFIMKNSPSLRASHN